MPPFRKIPVIVALVVLALALVLGGAFAIAPRTLLVARSGAPPWAHPTTLLRFSADAASVQRLEEAIQSLPPAPSGVVNCPADNGTLYRLTIFHHGAVSLRATVSATGCRTLRIVGEREWRASDDAFWRVFAQTLGVSPTDLIARPSAPSALHHASVHVDLSRTRRLFARSS
jgi:hypothetical protein